MALNPRSPFVKDAKWALRWLADENRVTDMATAIPEDDRDNAAGKVDNQKTGNEPLHEHLPAPS